MWTPAGFIVSHAQKKSSTFAMSGCLILGKSSKEIYAMQRKIYNLQVKNNRSTWEAISRWRHGTEKMKLQTSPAPVSANAVGLSLLVILSCILLTFSLLRRPDTKKRTKETETLTGEVRKTPEALQTGNQRRLRKARAEINMTAT